MFYFVICLYKQESPYQTLTYLTMFGRDILYRNITPKPVKTSQV